MSKYSRIRGGSNVHDCVLTCWELLQSGNVYKRAAAILLLQEVETYFVRTGRGEIASRLREAIKQADRERFPGLHDERGVMRP